MEALATDAIPTGPDWHYEPKWDGFRCLVFREGPEVFLQSKAGQPLARYFPEVVKLFGGLKAPSFVLDGELVIPAGAGFSFDALLQRIHPAASRVRKLAQETPASFVAFDLLLDQCGASLLEKPLATRRAALEQFAHEQFKGDQLLLSPATTKVAVCRKWLTQVGAALDGVIAKRTDLPYCAGERTGMQKIKNYRSADCVVGGFRFAQGKKEVGSLLLGLYDADGLLHHVGFTSGFKGVDKRSAHPKARALDSTSRLHRTCTGRAESLGFRALSRMAAAQAETRGRGELRPRQRRSLSPRDENPALAARQGAGTMHAGAACAATR